MHFVCARCASRLSAEVRELQSEAGLSRTPETDYLPAGFAFMERGVVWPARRGYWCINANDAIGMQVTEDIRRTNGCCGLDGGDGPNLLCSACGHEVATANSDCWMPRCVLFEPGGATAVV
jgi:hypothetical protein